MKIKKLTAKNFRLFTDLEINFPDENFICLIGNNGSGKSAVLDAVNMVMSSFIVNSFLTKYYQLSAFRSPRIHPENAIDLAKDIFFQYILKWKDKNNIRLNCDRYTIQVYIDNHKKEFNPQLAQSKNPKATFNPIYFRADEEINISIKKQKEEFKEIGKKRGDYFFTDKPPIWLYFNVKRLTPNISKTLDAIKNFQISGSIYETYKHLFKSNNYNNISLENFEDWYISFVQRENEKKVKDNINFEMEVLKPIKVAITTFFQKLHSKNYKGLSVKTEETETITSWEKLKSNVTLVKENNSEENQELKLSQLSSGEKMVTFMVAEIARKLTIANENKAEALNGKGVVLIDELDLHLHPNWQRNIVGALKATFPNVQFIVTTHSPQVLSSLKATEIIEIDGDKVYSPSVNPYGRDTNNILSTVMNDGARSKDREALINSIFINFAEDKNEKAIEQFEQLKPMLSEDDPIIGRIESIIKRKEILNS